MPNGRVESTRTTVSSSIRAPSAPSRADRRERHVRRASAARAARANADRQSRAASAVRLALAVGGLLSFVWAIDPDTPRQAWGLVGAAGLTFAAAVVVHDRIERRLRHHAVVEDVHRLGVARLDRDWDTLAAAARAPAVAAGHPYAFDLDVCGRASLFTLLDPGGTDRGRETLAGWLLAPAPHEDIVARQGAVAELTASAPFRDALAVKARLVADDRRLDIGRFVRWAEDPDGVPRWARGPWLGIVARALALATPGLLVAWWWNIVPAAAWLTTLSMGLVLSWGLRGPMRTTFESAADASATLGAWADVLALVAATPFRTPALQHLQQALASPAARPAHVELRRLERWASLADLRRSPLLHLPIHALTLWDVHVWRGVERWRQAVGPSVGRWIDAVGQCEALSALATLADDEPEWTMPQVDPRANRLEAHALGHPLIPDAARVPNDVIVGPASTVLLVTGSNMSGKSTLLRAIGLNAVIAQAGGPACARQMRLPPVDVFTSMRLADSLESGVSYFMAALQRLRVLVDRAGPAGGPVAGVEVAEVPAADGVSLRVLYLLDEILQGTNTAEREVAVRVILGHLLRTPAIGAVTTHDLGLVTAPELATAARLVHFSESFIDESGRTTMTFDYRLRPGAATSRNALRLMELVGLASAEEVRAVADAGGAGPAMLPGEPRNPS
jgi:hypothetical protein